MIIKNGLVFTEDKIFEKKDLYVEDHRIVEDAPLVTDRSEIDADGLMVIPGLIDVHSHGACGSDFCDADPEGLRKILRYQLSHGITSYCPTSMTLPEEQLTEIFSKAAAIDDRPDQAHIAGINMEGPFLDPIRKGAHAEGHIVSADLVLFEKLNAACGNIIRLVTLAPNMDNAFPFIQALHSVTHISLGHTSASYEVCKQALDAGADHVTHLFNAMLPFNHREPGLIGAAAETPHCMAELICDGIHIHKSAVQAAFSMFPDRIVLISDSMRATGMEDGIYDLGGQQVTVRGNHAALKDGTIAGSATNLFDCMRTAVSFGIPRETAIAAASMNPAKSIGIYGEAGSLTPGKRSDILLVDSQMNLVQVIK